MTYNSRAALALSISSHFIFDLSNRTDNRILLFIRRLSPETRKLSRRKNSCGSDGTLFNSAHTRVRSSLQEIASGSKSMSYSFDKRIMSSIVTEENAIFFSDSDFTFSRISSAEIAPIMLILNPAESSGRFSFSSGM